MILSDLASILSNLDSMNQIVVIGKSNHNGLRIIHSADDGIRIDDAGYNGLRIGSATWGRIDIGTTYTGIFIRNADADGMYIANAGAEGLHIGSASTGVLIQKSNGNGISVEHAGADGLYIGNADSVGLHIENSSTGIFIKKSNVNGISVEDAHMEGIAVGKAGWDGLYVQDAGRYGLCLDNSKNNFIVAGLADRKFQVKQGGRVDSVTGCSVPSCSAERVETKEGSITGYEPGDVLVISDSKDRTVEKSPPNAPYSQKVAGIYCEKPGITGSNHPLEDPKPNEIPLAVSGIVPCKVTGKIGRGDLLTTSSIAGTAMKASTPKVGTILGKAFGEWKVGPPGKIDVLVTLQ